MQVDLQRKIIFEALNVGYLVRLLEVPH